MAAQLQLVAPTVALLEGGYNLLSTARGTEAVVRVLLGERPPQLPPAQQQPCEYGMAAVAQVGAGRLLLGLVQLATAGGCC
jgi:histone deacetylase 6